MHHFRRGYGCKGAGEMSIALQKGAAASLSEAQSLEDPFALAASQLDQLTASGPNTSRTLERKIAQVHCVVHR